MKKSFLVLALFLFLGCIAGDCKDDVECFKKNLDSCSFSSLKTEDGTFQIRGSTHVEYLGHRDDKWCEFEFNTAPVPIIEAFPQYVCKNPVQEGLISRCTEEELNQQVSFTYSCKYRKINCEQENEEAMDKLARFVGLDEFELSREFAESYCEDLRNLGLKEKLIICYRDGTQIERLPPALDFLEE